MTTSTKSLRRLVLEALYVQPLAPRQLVACCDGYTYNTVVAMVRRLRDEGFIENRSDLDGSRMAYRLTAEGRTLVKTYQDGPRCPHCGGKL